MRTSRLTASAFDGKSGCALRHSLMASVRSESRRMSVGCFMRHPYPISAVLTSQHHERIQSGIADTGDVAPMRMHRSNGLLLQWCTNAKFLRGIDAGLPNTCWPWLKAVASNGYGKTYINKDGEDVIVQAHRVAFAVYNQQDIPAGLVIMHSCDNRRCCNPNHLILGTQTDNMRDASAKGRLNVSHPPAHNRKTVVGPDGSITSVEMAATTNKVHPTTIAYRCRKQIMGFRYA